MTPGSLPGTSTASHLGIKLRQLVKYLGYLAIAKPGVLAAIQNLFIFVLRGR